MQEQRQQPAVVRRGIRRLLLYLVASLLAATTVLAQPARAQEEEPSPVERATERMKEALQRIVVPPALLTSGPPVRAAFRDVVAPARPYTVRVKSDGRDVALGTVVSRDGLVLTKASQLGDAVTCHFEDGRQFPAEILGTHKQHDLAVLKIAGADLPAAQWAEQPAEVGQFVATVGQADDPLSIGVVGVAARKIAKASGILGVVLEEGKQGPQIAKVMPDSGAARAGVQIGDIVTHLNGKRTKNRRQLVRAVKSRAPGEEIRITVQRDGKKLELTATLTHRVQGFRPNRKQVQNEMGGKLSRRRFGFPEALQHDSVIAPTDCGGPLVNLDGQLVGINIARAGRTETFALPADLLRQLVAGAKSGPTASGGVAEISHKGERPAGTTVSAQGEPTADEPATEKTVAEHSAGEVEKSEARRPAYEGQPPEPPRD